MKYVLLQVMISLPNVRVEKNRSQGHVDYAVQELKGDAWKTRMVTMARYAAQRTAFNLQADLAA